MALFNRTMDNAAKARIAAYEAELQANAVDVDWLAEAEDKPATEADTIQQVYQALLDNQEGAGMVYLDNINLKALGITERQFAGYCSALAAMGKYEKTSDVCFGRVIE